MRQRRPLACVALATLTVAASLLLAGPAHAQTAAPSSCEGVLEGGGDEPLTKTLINKVQNADGTFTLTFRLTSSRTDLTGNFRVRDCLFVDANGNNQFDNEPFLGGTDEKNVQLVNGSATITVTVAASADDTICDRAALSGTTASGEDFTDKSNLLCTPLTGTPVIPEVPYVVLLPLTALLLLAGGFVLMRRRQDTALLLSS